MYDGSEDIFEAITLKLKLPVYMNKRMKTARRVRLPNCVKTKNFIPAFSGLFPLPQKLVMKNNPNTASSQNKKNIIKFTDRKTPMTDK